MKIPVGIQVVIERFVVFFKHVLQHFSLARRVWAHRKQFDFKKPFRDEAEFLPSALALQETPPSPLPRVGAWVLALLVVFAVLYCVLAKVDIVVVGDGTIVEKTHSRIISATTTARLLQFRVHEGDTVLAGQPLIDLDEEFAFAEVRRLMREREDAYIEEFRSQWMLRSFGSGRLSPLVRDSSISPERWMDAVELMKSAFISTQTDFAHRDALVSQKRAELVTAQETEKRMKDVLMISREREGDMTRMAKENVVSKHEALERRQDLIDREGELRTQSRRIQELENAIVVLLKERQNAEAALRKDLLEARKVSQEKVAQLDKELLKARAIQSECHLKAPIDGTVQQLTLQLVGGVALPGNQLLVIVPLHRELQVEANILNQDVGFLLPGMSANIKVSAFPYTKYGVIPGEIIQVSDDALFDDKKGLVFHVASRLIRDEIRLEKRVQKLSPGLQVSLEVKTGERRLIEYFLAPFIQKTTESFRER